MGGSIGAETAVTDVVEVVIRHSCGLCFAKFYTNEELHRHMALNHLGEWYICTKGFYFVT